MVFNEQTFYSINELSHNVPCITIGGIAKKYVVPGWRVGWCIVNDRQNKLISIRSAIESLSQLIVGANTLIQYAIPNLLLHTDPLYYTSMINTLQSNAMYLYNRLVDIPCFNVIKPQAAMYVMCEIKLQLFSSNNKITNDTTFCAQLLNEQNVILLPGSCFNAYNYVRFVYCAPIHILDEACNRIDEFCKQHIANQQNTNTDILHHNTTSNNMESQNGVHNGTTVQYDPIDET